MSPLVTPRRGRPRKPESGVPSRSEVNTISVAHWLSLGGPAGSGKAADLPGQKLRSFDVWARYHHWATRFNRPVMVPSVFGRAMLRLGVSGHRNSSHRFFVFPETLDLDRWVSRPCRVQKGFTPFSFDPERLPWVEGLRRLAAAEPDNPEWVRHLEALPSRNWSDPLDPNPSWVVSEDAPVDEPARVELEAVVLSPAEHRRDALAALGLSMEDLRLLASLKGSGDFGPIPVVPITRVEPPLS